MQLQAIAHFEPAKLHALRALLPWRLLTRRLPHLSCVTRITKCYLVNVAAFMIIPPIFTLFNIPLESHYIANLELLRTKQISDYNVAHHGWYST